MVVLLVVLAYLIGSVSFGGLANRLRATGFKVVDLPGASGTFRRYGTGAGLLVLLLDVGKGALVGYLSGFTPGTWWAVLMGMAVVSGHNWPVFFRFHGGGGIAVTLGLFIVFAPRMVLLALGLGLLIAALYYLAYWSRGRKGIYPLPLGSIFGFAFLLWALSGQPRTFWMMVAVASVVLARGVQILLRKI